MDIENLEAGLKVEVWDYCFRCGIPLTLHMQENRDWFNIRNNGKSLPICKECHEKAKRESTV